MSPLAILFAVLAALAPSVSAFDCNDGTGSCALDDITSLLQVKQDMKIGNERSEIEEAVYPSTRAAFDSNKEKVEDHVEAAAANRRAFEQEVEHTRAVSRKRAEDQVADDKLAVMHGAQADQDALETAVDEHRDAYDDASKRVSIAKRQWEETSAEKHNAEEAAEAGRVAGVNAGAQNAAEVRIEEAKAAAGAAMVKQIAREKAFEERRASEKRDAVDRQTMKQDAENNAIAGKSASDANEVIDRSAQRTKDAVHHMEKSEQAMRHSARQHVGHYEVAAETNRGRTEEAVSADWPPSE